MNLKAVAVPYVISLILGIIIIGIVGYFLIPSGGKLSGQSQSTECQTQRLIFCQGGGWKGECGTQPSEQECTQLFGVSQISQGGQPSTPSPKFVHVSGISPPKTGG